MPWSMIISMVCDLDYAPAKTFMLDSPSSRLLPFCLLVTAITDCISSPPFQVRASKEKNGIFMVIFSIFRTKLWHCHKNFLSAYEYTVQHRNIGVLGSCVYRDRMGLWYSSDQYHSKL